MLSLCSVTYCDGSAELDTARVTGDLFGVSMWLAFESVHPTKQHPHEIHESMSGVLVSKILYLVSALGPNGISYKFYKNCPRALKLLWTLMRTAWTKQCIPSQWQRAVAVFIPKEQNSMTIRQFRSIALLSVKGKIFFSVMARRMTSFLMENGYIDTSCQKAGIPGFPGCVQRATMIWEQIQRAKREKKDLHVVWLDLVSASPAHCVWTGLFLHPREHQGHGYELLPGHAHVFHAAKFHLHPAATGGGNCNGMSNLPHSLCDSI